ncbi:MAG: hypothetical protein WC780_02330 [Lentimicrobiaceae bacterium]
MQEYLFPSPQGEGARRAYEVEDLGGVKPQTSTSASLSAQQPATSNQQPATSNQKPGII